MISTWLVALVLAGGKLTVEVYEGGFASVNSFIFSNGQSLVVLDVQRKAVEAKKAVELVQAKGLPLTHILISHGHTDHFTGMAVFHAAFPDAKIVVATEAIKRDIKAYAIYMDQGGATGAEPAVDPALKPKTAEHPDGFDYERLKGRGVAVGTAPDQGAVCGPRAGGVSGARGTGGHGVV